ncbi:hypothetical protein Tco_0538748, partial [Tanacetum coccineum]
NRKSHTSDYTYALIRVLISHKNLNSAELGAGDKG